MSKIGFIGTGHMGSALIRVISENSKDLLLSNRTKEKAISLAKECGLKTADSNSDLAGKCDYIFLAVKPQNFSEVLSEIKGSLKMNTVLITMAAGYSMKRMEDQLSKETKIIRIMPNLPVSIHEGVILMCKNYNVTNEEYAQVKTILKDCGQLIDLKEELFNAGCALSGSGPAFVYSFVDALSEGAMKLGIEQETAKQMAIQTVIGSANLMAHSDKPAKQLIEGVCSKGGTTIEGVQVLNQNDFYKIIYDTLNASYKRGEELGKQ